MLLACVFYIFMSVCLLLFSCFRFIFVKKNFVYTNTVFSRVEWDGRKIQWDIKLVAKDLAFSSNHFCPFHTCRIKSWVAKVASNRPVVPKLGSLRWFWTAALRCLHHWLCFKEGAIEKRGYLPVTLVLRVVLCEFTLMS